MMPPRTTPIVRRLGTAATLVVLASLAVSLTACSAVREGMARRGVIPHHRRAPIDLGVRDHRPYPDTPDRSVSLVLSAPHVPAAPPDPSIDGLATTPWYHDRLDHRPGVLSGTIGSTLERSVTRSYDHQSIVHGRVYDRYHQWTYRTSVTHSRR